MRYVTEAPKVSVVSVWPTPDSASFLPGAQFSDSYSAVSNDSALTARAALDMMFDRQPRWIRVLMKLRDALVAPFGLKTAEHASHAADRVAIFPILSQTPTQLVAGLDDRHLDFRIIVDMYPSGARKRVVTTTMVKTHNIFGRTYLAIIMPFHRMIVRTLLARID